MSVGSKLQRADFDVLLLNMEGVKQSVLCCVVLCCQRKIINDSVVCYCYHPQVDDIPITAHLLVFYSSCTTAICLRLQLFSILKNKNMHRNFCPFIVTINVVECPWNVTVAPLS